ncbi:MAG: transposase [Xenococcus sp. MO_188.B8]|nr:transposase [Xenococcus sp. MO_188.B8]
MKNEINEIIPIYDDLISSARSVSSLKAHLVLVPKYRLPLFNNEMLLRLEEIVKKVNFFPSAIETSILRPRNLTVRDLSLVSFYKGLASK